MLVVNIQEEGRFGGPQKRIAEVAKGCKKLDCITIPVIPKHGSERFQDLLKDYGIDYETVTMHRLTKHKSHLLKYALFFPLEIYNLYRLFKRLKPDVVHCNGSFQIKGVIAARLTGIKSVWHMNDSKTQKPVKLLFSVLKKFFGDKFVAASLRSAEYYFGDNASDISILPAPVMTNVFSEASSQPALDIMKFKGIKISSVGNVNPTKSFDIFIRTAMQLNSMTDIDLHFFIVGPFLESHKSTEENLKQLISENKIDNIHFLGGRSDVADVLNATDIYVCSSKFEGSPISVWEAMSMSKPIVSTDVGDVRDIFEENNCGLAVPVDDIEALSTGIFSLIEDSNLAGDLSRSARLYAENNLDISICCKRHVEYYKEAIKGS